MRTWPALDISSPGDLLEAALLDYSVAAVDQTGSTWRVFFTAAVDRDAALAVLPSQFPDLVFTPIDVPDEDWAARSQASLRAVQVGSIIVAPPWDVPSGRPIPIIIQPSMGFGTGHHATTRLCLAALQALDLRGRSMLDVGTGSGVLAIAARRLGAARVVAIDDDPDAIQAARDNLALNDGVQVELQTVDLRSSQRGRFDVVTANLTGGLLIQAAARLRDVCAQPGHLVLSGFMTQEEPAVLAAYGTLGVDARAQEDEWVCVTLRQ